MNLTSWTELFVNFKRAKLKWNRLISDSNSCGFRSIFYGFRNSHEVITLYAVSKILKKLLVLVVFLSKLTSATSVFDGSSHVCSCSFIRWWFHWSTPRLVCYGGFVSFNNSVVNDLLFREFECVLLCRHKHIVMLMHHLLIYDSSRSVAICNFPGLVCRHNIDVWWLSSSWNPVRSIVIEFRLLG